jgi:hypothetical protein
MINRRNMKIIPAVFCDMEPCRETRPPNRYIAMWLIGALQSLYFLVPPTARMWNV